MKTIILIDYHSKNNLYVRVESISYFIKSHIEGCTFIGFGDGHGKIVNHTPEELYKALTNQ